MQELIKQNNEMREQRFAIERSQWEKGEWLQEPDDHTFSYRGFDCILWRNYWGNWCGYVALPKDHEYSLMEYHDVPVDCHGGLTYGEPRDDGRYWLGFDCGHAEDYQPAADCFRRKYYQHEINIRLRELDKMYNIPEPSRTYRNIKFAQKECESIIDQIIANTRRDV